MIAPATPAKAPEMAMARVMFPVSLIPLHLAAFLLKPVALRPKPSLVFSIMNQNTTTARIMNMNPMLKLEPSKRIFVRREPSARSAVRPLLFTVASGRRLRQMRG